MNLDFSRSRFPIHKPSLLLVTCLCVVQGFSQSKNVLFLGNSYTHYNDLPQMIAIMAAPFGDTLIHDSYTPGGATFSAHSLNTTSLSKIMAGGWDYVVLQGQSLEMWGNPTNILTAKPEVKLLDSLINAYSLCPETMFYRTWGRKNGFGTTPYLELDSIIHSNYMKLADSLDAVVSPVGEVWKYIRQHHPNIELYSPDNSHPSLAGTYAAACCFTTAIFREDPTQIVNNPGLPGAVVADIRNATKVVVYDSLLKWHIGEYDSLITACVTSVEYLESAPSFSVHPNPFSTSTTIQSNIVFNDATITVVNRMGQVVKEITGVSGQTLTLDRGNLSEGGYFMRVSDDDHTRVIRIVVRDQ